MKKNSGCGCCLIQNRSIGSDSRKGKYLKFGGQKGKKVNPSNFRKYQGD